MGGTACPNWCYACEGTMLPLYSTVFLAVIAVNVVAILVAAMASNGRRHDNCLFGQLLAGEGLRVP